MGRPTTPQAGAGVPRRHSNSTGRTAVWRLLGLRLQP